jgi:hypothetical protein
MLFLKKYSVARNKTPTALKNAGFDDNIGMPVKKNNSYAFSSIPSVFKKYPLF